MKDIDERTQLERQFRVIFQGSPTGIAVIDYEGRILNINPAFLHMLGYTSDELRTAPIDTLVAPQDAEEHQRHWNKLINEEIESSSYQIELTFMRKDGMEMIGNVNASKVQDGGEHPRYVIFQVEDITERKQAEKALKESESLLRAFFDAPGMLRGILERVDDDLCYISASRATAAVYGLTPDEVRGRCLSDLDAPSEIMQTYLHYVEETRRTGLPVSFEILRHFKTGDRWLSVTASYLGVGPTGLPRFAFVIDDITEHVLAEDALKKSEERLYQERTILNSIAENTEAHLAYLDPDFNFVWVNRTYADACNRPREEFIGRNHFDLFPHEENEVIFKKVRDTGEPAVFKAKPFAHPDQPEREVTFWDWTLVPVKDSSGKVKGIVLSLTDVTELKKSEQKSLKLLEKETETSRLLQRALLPAKPKIEEGYNVDYAYIPAFEGTEIGGDFYDVFKTEAGKVGILVGDVSGKGIPAASFAAITRSTIRAFAYETSSPGESLTHANAVLTGQDPHTNIFVTVLLIVLDPSTGRFCFSSAGHPPAVVCRKDGSAEFLKVGNLPICTVKDWEYEENEDQLCPDETIILYTDGITEARRGAELFGEEGIVRTLECISDRRPKTVVDALLKTSNEWAQGEFRDDTALLAVQRAGD